MQSNQLSKVDAAVQDAAESSFHGKAGDGPLDSRLAWAGHRVAAHGGEPSRLGHFIETRPFVRFGEVRRAFLTRAEYSVNSRASEHKSEEPSAHSTDAASFLKEHMRDERATREHRQPVTADRLPDMIAPYHIHRCGHLAGLGLDVPLSPWEADLLHASYGAAGSSLTLTREIVKTGEKHEAEIVGGGLGLSAAYLLASPPAWDEGECEQYLSQELGEEKELSEREVAMNSAKAQGESAQGGSEHGETGPLEEASLKAMDDYRRRAVVMWAVGEATVNEVVESCTGEGRGGEEESNKEGDGDKISEGENVGHAWQQRWWPHKHTRPLEQRHGSQLDKHL
ncbi:unnamed protein product [Closterium sp. Yama58-4]|nr:unnamed protein product [Closterium sp. Yama58-4]